MSYYTRRDFDHSPFVVFYELTQACDLACRHCRASAQPRRNPLELTTAQSKQLIDQLTTFPKPPLLVLTGGDPFKRPDLVELVGHAAGAGLSVALTPSATPLVTAESLRELADAGLSRLAVSLDGVDAPTHDAFRGVAGSFDDTLRIMADARRLGLPIQVNTTITRRNVHQVDSLAALLARQGVVLWSVFFLVPVGRGAAEKGIDADECEQVFEQLWRLSRSQPYGIKTTEAPHYRRFVLQQGDDPRGPAAAGGLPESAAFAAHHAPRQRAPLGVNDGRGVMFISHIGQVFPSGFLPIACGRFPQESVVQVYQQSPVMRMLRDPDRVGGKCGLCEFRQVCGGSRARAFAVSGDVLAEEPDCAYQPAAASLREPATACAAAS